MTPFFSLKEIKKICDLLRRDQSGIVLIYITILLPVIIGLALLAVDASRLQTHASSLQNAVDTLALEGAAELDLYPDALVRACNAMKNFANNPVRFEKDFKNLNVDCDANGMATGSSDVTWTFLKQMPSADRDADGNLSSTTAYETSLAAEALYIRIISKPDRVSFFTVFPVSLTSSVSNELHLSREAIGGLVRLSCRPIPLYLCNPWEGSPNYKISVTDLKTMVGQTVQAWEWGGTGSGPGPGQFGLADMLAEDPSKQCYGSYSNNNDILQDAFSGFLQPCCLPLSAIPPKTGVIANLQAEINTRFDFYNGQYNNLSNVASSKLSKIVPASRSYWYSDQYTQYSTTFTGDVCKPRPTLGSTSPGTSSSVLWYPRGTTSWSTQGTYFGKPSAPPSASSVTSVAVAGKPTRYETYKFERSQSAYQTPGPKTCFAKKLSSQPTLAALANDFSLRNDRRELTAAIVNCKSLPSSYFSGVSGGPIPYLAFGKFFITEPTNKAVVNDRDTNTTTQKVNVPSNCSGGSGNIYQLTPPTNSLPNTTTRNYTMPYSLEWRTSQYIKSFYFEVDPSTYNQTVDVSMLGLFLKRLQENIGTDNMKACSLAFSNTVSASDTSIYIQSSEFSASSSNAPKLFTAETDPYGGSNGPSRSINFELSEVYEPGNGNGFTYEFVKLFR